MDKYKNIYPRLTEKKLQEAIDKVANNLFTNMLIHGTSIVTGCKIQGVVRRTVSDYKLCNDSECKSCRQFEEYQTKEI